MESPAAHAMRLKRAYSTAHLPLSAWESSLVSPLIELRVCPRVWEVVVEPIWEPTGPPPPCSWALKGSIGLNGLVDATPWPIIRDGDAGVETWGPKVEERSGPRFPETRGPGDPGRLKADAVWAPRALFTLPPRDRLPKLELMLVRPSTWGDENNCEIQFNYLLQASISNARRFCHETIKEA